MPDYAVATAFTGRDNITPVFDRMGQSADRFKDRTSSAFRNSTKEGYKFATIVKGILAANLIRGGIDKVTSGLQKVGTDFLTFDDTIIGAVARFKDIGPGAANAAQMIGLLGKETRKSVRGTRFGAVDAAKAVNELAKADYTHAEALGILPNMMAFATASQEDLAVATQRSSQMLGAFDLKSNDTVMQLKNHRIMNDQVTKSVLLSTGSLEDLFETVKTAAPVLREFGQPQEKILAMAVALTNAGISGDLASTAMKRFALNMFSGKNAAELLANGVKISDDKTGKLRDTFDIIADLTKKLAPLREDVRAPILARLLGVHGLGGSLKLLKQLELMKDYTNSIKNNSNGTAEQVSKFQNMSTFAKVIELMNAAMEKGFQILDKFNGGTNKGIEGLIKKIDNFKVEPVVDALKAFVNITKVAYTVIEPFLPILPYVVAGFYAWKGAMAVITFAPLVLGFVQTAFAAAKVLGFFNLLTVAWKVFNASFIATPLGAAMIAGFSLFQAGKSLFTGKDNMISQAAQSMGLVPKLQTDADGRITSGGAGNYAPNAATAASQSQFQGTLNIAGAPQGSTLNVSQSVPGFNASLLGVNP